MSETPPDGSPGDERHVSNRVPELLVSAFLFGLAMLVITDSIRVGTGWADDGPRSGYFPFYIGLALAGSSGFVLLKQLFTWRRDSETFAERGQLASVVSILVPMVIYVGAIAFLGIYLSSFALILWFMKRHGKYGWPLSVGVSAAVPLLFFLVFERWFLVPLPKGPVEALLGL
jgi:putative tricarboxylic transport membrane protein